jgi:hypothetical protein
MTNEYTVTPAWDDATANASVEESHPMMSGVFLNYDGRTLPW